MIAVTTSGARLLDGREDWRLLDALTLAIAVACGYAGTEAGGALSYLLALDPPTGADDVVVWSWSEEPVRARHVPRPAPVSVVKASRKRVAA